MISRYFPSGTSPATGHSTRYVLLFESPTASLRSELAHLGGTPPEPIMHLHIYQGALYRQTNGGARWFLSPAYNRRRTSAKWERDHRAFAQATISALGDVVRLLPRAHHPQAKLAELAAEDLALVRRELPEAFECSDPVQENFGDCMLALARGFAVAREHDEEARQDAARHRRLRKQFDVLPAGTILIDANAHYPCIGIISDKPGQGTLRSVMIHQGNSKWRSDLDKARRGALRLMTPERARRLPKGLLSGHQAITALSQAKALAADFPDLA